MQTRVPSFDVSDRKGTRRTEPDPLRVYSNPAAPCAVEYLEASPTWISVDKGPPIVCDLRILAICGSLQAKSKNQALLKTFAASVPPGAEVRLFDGLRHLPHFNPDIEASGVPESVTQWRAALTASDAVLIACPEYGFSLPGVLKNGIDWVIGSGELEQKVVAITAAVAGPDRGRGGLTALRVALSAVRATIVGGEPIAQGPGLQSQVIALVQALVEAAASRNHTRVDEAGALAATHVLQPACFRDTA